jgi:tungstate transport system ATP-binding protein
MNNGLYYLESLKHSYGERQVLQIDQLKILRGEVLAVVGPSGAGKSTLMRLLNFLETPTTGTIHFQGTAFSAGQPIPLPLRRQVTTVFQRPYLLNRSVTANVRYGLRLRGKGDETDRVAVALEQVGLQAMARQRARLLSGGEAQRVALARALVINPDVLLLDEPTANLDPQNVAIIEDILTRLNQTQGVTLILVTHNIFQARRLAQRVMFLLDGRLVEIADTNTFFHNPLDSRTAAFVGGDMVY